MSVLGEMQTSRRLWLVHVVRDWSSSALPHNILFCSLKKMFYSLRSVNGKFTPQMVAKRVAASDFYYYFNFVGSHKQWTTFPSSLYKITVFGFNIIAVDHIKTGGCIVPSFTFFTILVELWILRRFRDDRETLNTEFGVRVAWLFSQKNVILC